MYITYFASNDNLGDLDSSYYDYYRSWATKELRQQYPDHTVVVVNGNSINTCDTDDKKNFNNITVFCAKLYCRFDWAKLRSEGQV